MFHQNVTAGFALICIRVQSVYSVLPTMNGGPPFSAPAAREYLSMLSGPPKVFSLIFRIYKLNSSKPTFFFFLI